MSSWKSHSAQVHFPFLRKLYLVIAQSGVESPKLITPAQDNAEGLSQIQNFQRGQLKALLSVITFQLLPLPNPPSFLSLLFHKQRFPRAPLINPQRANVHLRVKLKSVTETMMVLRIQGWVIPFTNKLAGKSSSYGRKEDGEE